MPIGKNALKRVTNNGYSKVSCEAPDMENSTHEPEVVSVKAEEPKKSVAKEKKTKSTAKKTAAKNTETSHPDGFARVSLGADLPIHLL